MDSYHLYSCNILEAYRLLVRSISLIGLYIPYLIFSIYLTVYRYLGHPKITLGYIVWRIIYSRLSMAIMQGAKYLDWMICWFERNLHLKRSLHLRIHPCCIPVPYLPSQEANFSFMWFHNITFWRADSIHRVVFTRFSSISNEISCSVMKSVIASV